MRAIKRDVKKSAPSKPNAGEENNFDVNVTLQQDEILSLEKVDINLNLEDFQFFLIDTKQIGDTAPLVQIFKKVGWEDGSNMLCSADSLGISTIFLKAFS